MTEDKIVELISMFYKRGLTREESLELEKLLLEMYEKVIASK